MSFWQEVGAGGERRARGKGSLLQARDLRGWEIRRHKKGTAFQVRVQVFLSLYSFSKKDAPACNCLCVQNKKELSV
jgi:hypothetical protein